MGTGITPQWRIYVDVEQYGTDHLRFMDGKLEVVYGKGYSSGEVVPYPYGIMKDIRR